MNYGMSGTSTGLRTFESAARRALAPAPTKQSVAQTAALGYTPDDGDLLMGWSIKKPFGSKKSVLNQVFKVVTAPVKIASAVALQTVGLKHLAGQVGGDAISKNLLKSIGQVTQSAVGVAAAVIAAPVVVGGVAAAAGAVASGVSAAAGAIGAAVSAVGSTVGTAVSALGAAKSLTGGGAAQQQAEAAAQPETVDAQACYDAGVADATANKERVQQANGVAQQYYTQGYDDMVTQIVAQQSAAKQSQQEVQQAVGGNTLTGTSKLNTGNNATSNTSGGNLFTSGGTANLDTTSITGDLKFVDKPLEAGGITSDNVKLIASIAAPLLLIGLLFSRKEQH